jgi:hypothetical protein
MENLVLLCRRHHRLVHGAGYGVHVAAVKVIDFRLPDGKIFPHGPDTRFRGNVVAIKDINRRNNLIIIPGTSIPDCHGDRMDHVMAVGMLLACE